MEDPKVRLEAESFKKIEPRAQIQNKPSWENFAIEVITNYYKRSGVGRGNYDRAVDFKKELLNIVGFSLNCFRTADLSDPQNWNESELLMAENGNKIFDFDDKGDRDLIKAMRESCENDDINYFNVLPIIYRVDSSLYFTPLFRLRRFYDKQPHFVDAKGRVYDNFKDWEEHNSLPTPCIFIFPTNGILNGSSTTTGIKKEGGNSQFINNAADLAEKFGGPLGSAIAGPIKAVQPISEMIDRITHGESINPFTDKEAASLWVNTSMKVSGPLGKLMQMLGLGSFKVEKKELKSEKVSEEDMLNLKTILSTDNDDEAAESIVVNADSFHDNPMTIKDMMKTVKFFAKTTSGCLKLSILLGFNMRTKFFYYNKEKLELIKALYDVAIKIDGGKTFRLTNHKEIVVGPLVIEMNLLEDFSCEDIVTLVGSFDGSKLSSLVILDFTRYFKNYSAFLRCMLAEHKKTRGSTEEAENSNVNADNQSEDHSVNSANEHRVDSVQKNVEQMRIYIAQNRKLMMNYHNHDYELSKCHGSSLVNSWCSMFKILQKRLGIFAKIIDVVSNKKFDCVTYGTVFHFTKLPKNVGTERNTSSEEYKVFPMLIFVYKTLRENFIPFTVKKCQFGRPLFHIGYGLKIHLDVLYKILKTDHGSIQVLLEICHLDEDETKKFDFIKSNINNDQALIKWLRCSFKTCTDGLKQIMNLEADVLSNEFKGMVEIFIADNERETNGLLVIRTGVYRFLITIHVLHQLTRNERISMMKSFGKLLDHDELINVFGKVFIEKQVQQEDLPLHND